jgi:hypothetical protein
MEKIREIYHKHPTDGVAGFARGILGRNLRYNLNSFKTAGVFFEKSPEYSNESNGESIWKDSSFMYYHTNSCTGQRKPGNMAIVVPIFGTYQIYCDQDCTNFCEVYDPAACTITLGNNTGGTPCAPQAWSRAYIETDPFNPQERCCNCITKPWVTSAELEVFQPGGCDMSDYGNWFDSCLSLGNNSWNCCSCPREQNDPPGSFDCSCSVVPSTCITSAALLGGANCVSSELSLHYPKTNLTTTCFGFNFVLENTKRVLLEDGSCVEMLCPECNNYPPCGS